MKLSRKSVLLVTVLGALFASALTINLYRPQPTAQETRSSPPASRDELPPPPEIHSLELPQPAAHPLLGNTPTGWRLTDQMPRTAIALDPSVVVRSTVALDETVFARLRVGDKATLPLPDGTSIVAEVKRTQVQPNGDRTWFGHVAGIPGEYPVIYTQGKQSAFATIATPHHSYTLETSEGNGWIYENPDDVGLADPSKPDYLIPQPTP